MNDANRAAQSAAGVDNLSSAAIQAGNQSGNERTMRNPFRQTYNSNVKIFAGP